MAIKKHKRNSARSKDSTHYENIFEYNVNFKERVIYLNNEINEGSLELIQKAFDELDKTKDMPIKIEISSYGGSIYDMLGIIDRIKASPCHVITRGFGKIMSAATFILASGDERYVGTHSWIMIHEMSDVIKGKISTMEHDMKHNNAIQKQMYKMYEDFSASKLSAKQWAKLCEKDHYISAEDALKLGLVDHVIE
jgi:ATP-dependent Clp protease protease subunit